MNLAKGTATGTGGIKNIGIVIGGSGNDTLIGDNNGDVLMGNGGNDTLSGGSGRDLLFGGTGSDILNGGAGQDILFDSTTNFGSNWSAIDSLFAFWKTGSDTTFSSRVSQLKAGGVSGVPSLNASNVLSDSFSDILTGGQGNDWFFANSTSPKQDSITDLTSVDLAN